MDETTATKTTGNSGDTNTTTSGEQSTKRRGKTKAEQNEKPSEISLVDQGSPAEVFVEISTEGKSDVPKPKKQREKKVKERSEAEKVKDIQNLLEGVFMVASLKAGEHWTLSSEESKQIAQPLSRILDRYDLLNKATEVSDPVALVVATATIIFPRVMVTKMSADQKKTETLKKNGVIGNVQKGSDPVLSGSDVRASNTTASTNDGEFIKAISNEVQTGL